MALTDEELTEIRSGHMDDQDAVVVLLAEVERLREEGDLVAAMRGYARKVKRGAAWVVFCLIGSEIIWDISSDLVPQPWTALASIAAGLVVGAVAGACVAWLDDRREARRG